jgi:uncharacterized membrane protein
MKNVIDKYKGDWPLILIVLLGFILGLIFLPFLPNEVAVHWSGNGVADGYLPKFLGVFLSPMLGVLLFFLLEVIPHIGSDIPMSFYIMDKLHIAAYFAALVFLATQVYTLISAIGLK